MGDCTIVYPHLSRAIVLLSRQPLFFLLNGLLKIPRYQPCNRPQKPTLQGANSKGLFNGRHLQKSVDQHAERSVRKPVRIVEYLVGKPVALQRHSQDLFIELVGSVNALLTPFQLYRITRAFSHTYPTTKAYALVDFYTRLSLLDALYGTGINTAAGCLGAPDGVLSSLCRHISNGFSSSRGKTPLLDLPLVRVPSFILYCLPDFVPLSKSFPLSDPLNL